MDLVALFTRMRLRIRGASRQRVGRYSLVGYWIALFLAPYHLGSADCYGLHFLHQ